MLRQSDELLPSTTTTITVQGPDGFAAGKKMLNLSHLVLPLGPTGCPLSHLDSLLVGQHLSYSTAAAAPLFEFEEGGIAT